MTRKIYRTAQGKQVDLGAIQLRNENVRAVGNMNVNARGDLIDSQNRPIDRKTDSVQRSYQRQTGNVQNQPVTKHAEATTKPVKKEKAPKPAAVENAAKIEIPPPPEDFQDDFQRDAEPVSEPAGGLAAAIAKARTIRQQPIRDQRELAKPSSGLKKI